MRYVSFYSEGEPNDKGINLSNSVKILTESLKKTNMDYSFYTPQMLKNSGHGEYVKEHKNPGLVSRNPNLNMIGFCAWKPLIMLLELEKMNYGDILIYRDCNCEKYPQLKNFDNIETNIQKLFDIVKFDFIITGENFHITEDNKREIVTVENHCKPNVVNAVAKNIEFTKKFPSLIAHTIICKKSDATLSILEEWRKCCSVDEYINGEEYVKSYPEFRWYTPEQAILSVVISNYVYEGKYNIPKKYPNLILEGRNIDKPIIVDKEMNVESFDIIRSNDSYYIVIGGIITIGLLAYLYLKKKYLCRWLKNITK